MKKVIIRLLLSIISLPLAIIGSILLIPFIVIVTIFYLPAIVLKDIWEERDDDERIDK